ncbi:MAG: hypothetical protein GXY42_02380 [Desulfovibrionales bacterium]|nr:hypothetical protein [Desulfovibrionales bacterium]
MKKPTSPDTLWHYSKAGHLQSIFDSGELRLATIGVPLGERPALWLSSDPNLEWTAYPKATVQELEESAYQPVHFCLNPAALERGDVRLVPWKKHRQKGGVTPAWARALEKVAQDLGASHRNWWCSYAPISVEHFSKVEIMVGGKWVLFAHREV